MSTRAELKENILAAKVEIALTWVLDNRGPLLAGLGIALAALLIGSVFILRSREIKNTNLTRLALVESLVGQEQFDRAAQITVEMHSTITNNALLARIAYFDGLAALGLKDFDRAVKSFTEAVDRSARSPLKPLATSNLGFSLEQKKDYTAASQTYGKFMTEFGEHFLAARIQLALGRSLAAEGKLEEAKKALTQLIDLYPTSHWAENARSIMDKNKTR